MQSTILWGWDSANEMWRRIACDTNGRIIIDPSSLYSGLNIDPRTVYKVQNDHNRILHPGESQNTYPWDGAFALRFPDYTTFVTCEGGISLLNTPEVIKFQIMGHINASIPSWTDVDVFLLTRHSNIVRVRFCRDDSGNWFVVFGETDDSWRRVGLYVTTLCVGYEKYDISNWDTTLWFEAKTSMPLHVDADITDARI